MLTIRLSRVGKKNKPMYRLVISEKARDPYGHALEILGSYNPHTKELAVKGERIKYWIAKGSQMSPTINNLLLEKGIIEGKKVKASIARKSKKAVEAAPAEIAKKPEEKKVEQPKLEEAKPADPAQEVKEAPKPEPAEAPAEEKKEA
jgi:small subunit ribosomal protein S16